MATKWVNQTYHQHKKDEILGLKLLQVKPNKALLDPLWFAKSYDSESKVTNIRACAETRIDADLLLEKYRTKAGDFFDQSLF